MAAYQLVTDLVGDTNNPQMKVSLARTEPADPEPYRKAFKGLAVFNAEKTSVTLSSKDLNRRNAEAGSAKYAQTGATLRMTWHAGDCDLNTKLRRAICIAIMSGDVSAARIAVEFGVGRRSFDRRLEEAGIHYQEVLDETRFEFTQQLLANTCLTIGSIASIVGFADPSTLTRTFIHWTRMTPSRWRENLMRAEHPL